MDRRTFLAGTGLLATGVAGCAGGDGTPPDGAGTATTDPGTTTDGSTPVTTTDGPTPVVTRTGERTPDVTPSPSLRNGSFEQALWGWFLGTDVPTDPNTGDPVETSVRVTGFGGRSDGDAPDPSEGDHALALSIDGRQDDGTVWVYQPVELADVATLSVDVYSESESFNTVAKVAAYAGPGPGHRLVEGDFDTSRASEDHAGWAPYEYPVDHDGAGVVAVGISAVWETEMTRYLDAVTLS